MNASAVHYLRLASLASMAALAALATGCGSRPLCSDTNTCLDQNADMGLQAGRLTIWAVLEDGSEVDPAGNTYVIECPAGSSVSSTVINLRARYTSIDNRTNEDVTQSVKWKTAAPDFFSVGQAKQGGQVTVKCPLPHGGAQTVSAEGKGGYAAAPLVFNYKAPPVINGNANAGAPDSFNGPADPFVENQPQIVYPIDQAMHPVNLGQIFLQWWAPSKHTLFRIHLTGTLIDASFYVGNGGSCATNPDLKRGGNNCIYTPPPKLWRTVTESMKGGSVQMTISGTQGRDMEVADSASITLNLSPEYVRGGLYYFSPSIQGLKRIPFGSTNAQDFIKGGDRTEIKCVGCHGISADGTKIAATFYGADGLGGIYDTNTNKFSVPPLSSPIKRWNFATFSPDGTKLLTNWGGVLTLRDGRTGARKYDIDPTITGGKAIMPDWSPDGSMVAFVQVPADGKIGKDFQNTNLQAGDWVAANTGNIAIMKFEGGAFQTAKVLVPSTPGSEYHYFPSFSPDSRFVLFVTASAQGAHSDTAWPNVYSVAKPILPPAYQNYVMTYDQDTAHLRLANVAGGDPIELASATHAYGKTVSWPRFSPFLQKNVAFFTFSAKFDYGFQVVSGIPQLWMSGIDLGHATENPTADPSYPPIWLPFQEKDQKNHSGIWTREITCESNNDCGDDYICQDKKCVPVTTG